jgi:hypothetical protein
MNQIKSRKCIVCGRYFEYCTVRVNPGIFASLRRGKNAVTCSSECSRIYTRIVGKIASRRRYGKFKEKE